MIVCQLLVLDAELVQDRCVQIRNTDAAVYCGVPQFIGCTIHEAWPKPTARHKQRESVPIMMPSGTILRNWQPTKFT